MNEAKIKACHGCGNPKPEIKTEAPEHKQVRCDRCDTRGPVCTTTEWAIVYWNTLGSRTAGDREPAMSKTAGTKHVGISDLLAAFVKELEATATSTADNGYKKLKKQQLAAYHNANGMAKVMRLCAKRIRQIQIAANAPLQASGADDARKTK